MSRVKVACDACRHRKSRPSTIALIVEKQDTVSTYSPKSISSTDTTFFGSLADEYDTHVFPFIPIITKQEYLNAIAKSEYDRESAALVHVLGARTLNMRPASDQDYQSTRDTITTLAAQAIDLRGPIRPQQKLTARAVMISAMVSICMLAHHSDHDLGFFYLREATTLVQILGSPKNSQPIQGQSQRDRQLERIYWLLFVHERFAAVSLFRQPILPHSAVMVPTFEQDENLSVDISVWFTSIVRLFSTLDQTIIEKWIDRGEDLVCDLNWLKGREAHLNEVMHLLQQQDHLLSGTQLIDLITTDLWLRTLLWKIALSNLLLTSNTPIDSMSVLFPLHLSQRLRNVLNEAPQSTLEVHGSGVLEKIFDVTITFADILAHMPTSAAIDLVDRLSDFIFLRDYLQGRSRLGNAERPILVEKTEMLKLKFGETSLNVHFLNM